MADAGVHSAGVQGPGSCMQRLNAGPRCRDLVRVLAAVSWVQIPGLHVHGELLVLQMVQAEREDGAGTRAHCGRESSGLGARLGKVSQAEHRGFALG